MGILDDDDEPSGKKKKGKKEERMYTLKELAGIRDMLFGKPRKKAKKE